MKRIVGNPRHQVTQVVHKPYFLARFLSRAIVLRAGKEAAAGRRAGHRSSPAFAASQVGKLSLSLALLLGLVMAAIFSSVGAMEEMHDDDLANITGQALMQMAKTPGQGISNDVTFYKAGLDAMVELNLNIDKLQLGCTAGAINGQHCDIDIDHLSLAGTTGKPDSSAMLLRPFFEFAIKNDQSTTLREVIGIRLSSEGAKGMLTAGQNTSTPNGINTMSGYMVAATNTTNSNMTLTGTNGNFTCGPMQVCGEAWTAKANIGCGMNAAQCQGGVKDPYSTVMKFDTHPNITLCTNGCYPGNTGTSIPNQSKGIFINEMPVTFTADAAVVNGRRQTSTQVVANAPVPTLPIAGQLKVNMEDTITVAYFISVSQALPNITGQVSGLNTKVTFNEDLGYIHRINVDSPFSLSFQGQNVKWPGSAAADVAQTGWWMSFADPVNLGRLDPNPALSRIDIAPAFSQMATAFDEHFKHNCTQKDCVGPVPINTKQGLDQLLNGQMTINLGNQTIGAPAFLMNVNDVVLGTTQNVPGNCWGSAKFC